MSDANSSGDSSELEALFDSIAGGVVGSASTQAPAPAPAAATKPSLMQQVREVDSATDDSKELQALFDSIAAKRPAPSAGAAGSDDGSTTESGDWPVQGKVFNQVGQMARQLHDTLGSLGEWDRSRSSIGVNLICAGPRRANTWISVAWLSFRPWYT